MTRRQPPERPGAHTSPHSTACHLLRARRRRRSCLASAQSSQAARRPAPRASCSRGSSAAGMRPPAVGQGPGATPSGAPRRSRRNCASAIWSAVGARAAARASGRRGWRGGSHERRRWALLFTPPGRSSPGTPEPSLRTGAAGGGIGRQCAAGRGAFRALRLPSLSRTLALLQEEPRHVLRRGCIERGGGQGRRAQPPARPPGCRGSGALGWGVPRFPLSRSDAATNNPAGFAVRMLRV